MSHTADSSQNRVEDLMRLLEVTRELGASVELEPLLNQIGSAATAVLGCERATVFIYDRVADELYSLFATGVREAGIKEIRFPATRGIAGEAARTGKLIDVPDAYADPRFNPDPDKQTGFRTRNILTCPLRGHANDVVGVLQAVNKRDGGFDVWDHDKIQILGAQAGVAVQRNILLDAFAAKQRIEADLNIARLIQQRLLPRENPDMPGFEIAGWNKPADQTGGDCFDFMPLPDGRLAITLADATGHGIGPALVISETRALFRAIIHENRNLAHAVTRVNALLCEDLPDDRFVTAFFGVLIPQENRIAFTSAGQGPLLTLNGKTGEIREIPSHGLPLGILEDTVYDEPGDFAFAPGDMMMLFTDGFFEWAPPGGEQFGMQRLRGLVQENSHKSPADIIDIVYRAVLQHVGATPQSDDLTAVIIKRA